MLTATALVTDPSGLALLRAVLATGPGYAARKAAAAVRPCAGRQPVRALATLAPSR
jgi:hypothetical protein